MSGHRITIPVGEVCNPWIYQNRKNLFFAVWSAGHPLPSLPTSMHADWDQKHPGGVFSTSCHLLSWGLLSFLFYTKRSKALGLNLPRPVVVAAEVLSILHLPAPLPSLLRGLLLLLSFYPSSGSTKSWACPTLHLHHTYSSPPVATPFMLPLSAAQELPTCPPPLLKSSPS